MLKTFVVIPFLLFTLSAVCNDTLTKRQVYNFNVGDTFDYKHSSFTYYGVYDTTYDRFIITGKYYSAGNDTLYITRKRDYPLPVKFDTLVIDSLDQYEYLLFFYNLCQENITDTNALYHGRSFNSICIVSTDQGGVDTFAVGLGVVHELYYYGNPGDGFGGHTDELIYYSNGSEHWGTPYEIVSGMQFINYRPIPEECATWVRTVFGPYYDSKAALQEKITEGVKIPFHGHTYVQLLYSYYNYNDHTYLADSMLGYFRNDTLNRSAYLYQSLTDTAYGIYDFKTQVYGPTVCFMDTIHFSDGYRARWRACYNYINAGMIEGVGGIQSIWPVRSPTWRDPYSHQTYYLYGTLSSFCVCGNVLYTDGTGIACEIADAINELPPSASIKVYPNPSTGNWQLLADESLIGNKLAVYNTEGRLMFQSVIKEQRLDINFNSPPGIYLLQITSPQVNIVRKLVRL